MAGAVAAYTRLIDADFVHVSDLGTRRTRAEIPAYVAAHGDYHATYAITRLTWKIAGQVAIVDAELREYLPDHDGGIMEADIFVWRGNRRRYRHHERRAALSQGRPGDRGARAYRGATNEKYRFPTTLGSR